MSNGPKVVKPVKEMTRLEELVSKLTNKHAQSRATQEWQALIEIAKMDGTTVQEAFALVRDIIALRQVLAMEAIAGELHGINQGVMNFVLMTEMAQNPESADDDAAPEETEPDSNQVMDPMTSGGTPVNELRGEQVEP